MIPPRLKINRALGLTKKMRDINTEKVCSENELKMIIER